MKSPVIYFLFLSLCLYSQNNLPKWMTQQEKLYNKEYIENYSNLNSDVITTPPNFSVRTMAEWEEIQALTIAWEGFEPILTEIVRNSVNECKVFIACENPNEVENYLQYYNVDTQNVEYLEVETNSIWMRDYGQNTIYKNDVDSIYLVDWVYNRPRPDDDTFPEFLSDYMDINLYQTSQNPNALVHTGGNFMSDGFGTAFSSNLVIDENDISENDIDEIMQNFMGINNYIKMETLPFDGIHHIDMHMKLLDEETLLVAEYPEGLSDGPQIEENLQYIMDNFTTKWGTPFNVIRIPSPPSSSGYFPGEQPELNNSVDGYYRTYTNSVFVNKTVLVPFYREEYDTVAQRIYEEALPGYNIVGIDCDNSGSNIISQSGAIHCITHSVGVNDPLLISFKKIEESCYLSSPYVNIQAMIKHRSGISEAKFNYRIQGSTNFNSIDMQTIGNDLWDLTMTFDSFDVDIEYYISAEANNGKFQSKPITAPDGYFSFYYGSNESCAEVLGCTDLSACNYNPSATIDDENCEYPEIYYDCENECLFDIDNDDICDELDNCINIFNPDQADFNLDGIGDDCDGIDIYENYSTVKDLIFFTLDGKKIKNIEKSHPFLILRSDGTVVVKQLLK